MGFRIQAAIGLTVGSAVLGFTKLRQAALGASDAIRDVNGHVKAVGRFKQWSDHMRSAIAEPLRTAFGYTENQKSLWARLNQRMKGVTPEEEERITRAMSMAEREAPQTPFGNRKMLTDRQARIERDAYDLHLKEKRLYLQQANLIHKIAAERRQNLEVALRGVNAFTFLSKEARGWINTLGIEIRRTAKGPLKAMEKGVKNVVVQVQGAKREFGNFSAIFAGALGALGGAQLIGGTSGIFNTAIDMARAKEDSRVTFDTLLGSAEQSEILLSRIAKYSASTPFELGDIIEASRLLLTVTGKNVEKNEELYKLAANMAALKPGTRVADVGSALVSASVGEFDSLKSLGIVLRAERFKDAGAPGTVEYADEVMSVIADMFNQKVGGRDLVASLGATMSGLMSTFRDNFTLPLQSFGEAIIMKLDVKQLLMDTIPILDQFARLLKFTLTGFGEFDMNSENPPPMLLAMADVVREIVDRLAWMKTVAVDTFKTVAAYMNSADESTRKFIVKAAGALTVFMTAATVLGPVILGAISLLSGLAAPLSAVWGTLASFLTPVGAVILTMTALGIAAFSLFREEGESIIDTLGRLAELVKGKLLFAWDALKVAFGTMYGPIMAELVPAWNLVSTALLILRDALAPFLVSLIGVNFTLGDVARIAYAFAQVISTVIVVVSRMTEYTIRFSAFLVRKFSPILVSTSSDIKAMVNDFLAWISGAKTGMQTLKTFLLGFADVITMPFREAIAQMFETYADTADVLSKMVRPYSETVANVIASAAGVGHTAAAEFREGFLSTRADLLDDVSQAVISVQSNQTINVKSTLQLDGETVAENQSLVQARARNSGRGGDPLNPEEMGFAVSDGRIRVVGAADVLAGMGGAR